MNKLISAAAILACAGAAQANFIMQSLDFGPNTPNYQQTLTFDKHDGSLGALLSVQVKLSIAIENGSATVDNDGVDPATVDVQFGASGAISSVDVPLLDAAFQPVVGDVDVFDAANFALSANDSDPAGQFDDDGGPDNGTLNVSPMSDQDSGFIADSLFGNYVGAGDTFDVLVDVDTLFEILGQGGVAGAFVPVDASGNVMVIYEYVPTPGAAGLLAIAGVAATRRRR
jgi:hypothetical protein